MIEQFLSDFCERFSGGSYGGFHRAFWIAGLGWVIVWFRAGRVWALGTR